MSTRDILLNALQNVTTDALVTNQHAERLADELAQALDAAGFVIRKKPRTRKPAELVEVFNPQTGDPALDAFMRKHHHSDWQTRLKKATVRTRPGMLNMPAPAPGLPVRPLTQEARAALYRHHQVIQHSA